MKTFRELISIITEENLGASQIPKGKSSGVTNPATGKMFSRTELFLHKVKTKSPFTLVAGGTVTIDPKEAAAVTSWLTSGEKGPRGTITMRTIDGGSVKNTELQKTVEFGSKEAENISVKGSDIFNTTDTEITDFANSIEQILNAGGFPAGEMYDKIATSPNINKLGKVGKAVVDMAYQITKGNVPTFPKGLSAAEIKAIELYASEYLGVLGLIYGTTPFKKGNLGDFDEFIGKNLADMIMYFPKSVSNPLADSFSLMNDENGHAIKISSKAAGKGAPPSLSSMKLPDDVRKRYPEVAEFYDAATAKDLSAFTQPFAMMNWLYRNNPKKVPKEYGSLVPFTKDVIHRLEESEKNSTQLPRTGLMDKFFKRLSKKVQDNSSTDGGKAWHAVCADVIHAVNDENAVDGFTPAIIESLGFNFIQVYSNVKGDKLVSEAFWPATIRGQVKLKTKGSSSDPKKGKISVEISPGKGGDFGPDDSDDGEVDKEVDAAKLDAKAKRAGTAHSIGADAIGRPKGASTASKSSAGLGRERR